MIMLRYSVFLISFLFVLGRASAQEKFWGMTPTGGISGTGVIFNINSDGTGFIKSHDFFSPFAGLSPYYTNLIEVSPGVLYGMTRDGGTYGSGVIFEYNYVTGQYSKKHDFNVIEGSLPYGSLMLASNGKLYGMTVGGGDSQVGVLFEFDINNNGYSVKFNFDFANGSMPYGGLAEGPNGKLYGMTSAGGITNTGVLFEYDLGTGSFLKVRDFEMDVTGVTPYGSLILASNGKMYGLTSEGGAGGAYFGGVLFEFEPASKTYTEKKSLGLNQSGYKPMGDLMEYPDGKLYGTTWGGGLNFGTLFSYDPVTDILAQRFNFTFEGRPGGTLVLAGGKLYGYATETFGNPDTGPGGLFEFDPATSLYVHLTDVNYVNATKSKGSLMRALNGKLYGMTVDGASTGGGILYEYTIANQSIKRLFDFNLTYDGAAPAGNLAQAFNGKLYGLTPRGGGSINSGVLFEIDMSSTAYSKKHEFVHTGFEPRGSLLLHPNGKLYGLTFYGANYYSYGTIFEYDPNSDQETDLVTFDPNLGKYPEGSLALGLNGKMYGTTRFGGTQDKGVIFEFDPFSLALTKKYDFNGMSGSNPTGDLVMAPNHKFYGTAGGGVNNFGVLFEFDPQSGLFQKLYDFTGDAIAPGDLVVGPDGKLYGMTRYGGDVLSGILYMYDQDNRIFQKLFDFGKGTYKAGTPYGRLSVSPNGKLYGMTRGGSTAYYADFGTIFEFDPSSHEFNVSKLFDGLNGSDPLQNALVITRQSQSIVFDAMPAMTYGDADFTLTASSSSGLAVSYGSSNPDVARVVDNQLTIVGTGTTTLRAFQIGNNSFLPAPLAEQVLVVNKAVLLAKPDDKLRFYGDVNPELTINYSGFKGNDDKNGIDVPPSLSTTATTTSHVGSYSIILSGGSDNNYSFNFQNGTLSVTKAILTARADDKSKTYADANPTLTMTFTGFKGTDEATDLDASPSISTLANAVSPAGSYPITLSDGLDNDYVFLLQNGTLSINKAALNVTGDDKIKPYGDDNPVLTMTYTGFKGTDDKTAIDFPPALTTAAIPTSIPGTYPITVSGGSDNNYTFTLINGILTVTKQNQTIAFPAISNRTMGDPSITLAATASSGLIVAFSSSSNRATVSGNQVTLEQAGTVTITAVQEGDGDFNAATPVDQTFCIYPVAPIVNVSTSDSGIILTSSSPTGNQWSLNGTPLPGAILESLVVPQPGIYSVTVTIDNCESESSGNQPVSITEIDSPKVEEVRGLYPNPVKDSFTLQLKGFSTWARVEVVVVDLNGRKIESFESTGGCALDMQVSNYEAGVYTLIAVQGSKKVNIQFIKE